MRVMLDTNILISAFVFKSNIINKLINELSKKHEIIICSYTIDELKNLIEDKFSVSIRTLNNFLKDFPFTLVQSPKNPQKNLFYIRDENDYIILYTAIVVKVDVFITGDKDFESVNVKKTEILKPSEFIQKYLS